MGKVEDVIKSEIARLTRKQLRADVVPLTRDVRELKRTVSRLTKTVDALERVVSRQERARQQELGQLRAAEDEVKKARLSPGLIQKLRKRLGLTQSALATLVGVSPTTVALWESGRTAPRGGNREAVVALRKLGRRDVKRLLAEKKPAPAKKTSAGKKKAGRGRPSQQAKKK